MTGAADPALDRADRTERSVEVSAAGKPLFRYVYDPLTPRVESPRPYLHPVRTLGGREVAVLRPEDHPWHAGVSFTATDVSGENFWGGPTYVAERKNEPSGGYVDLDNQGVIRHEGFQGGPGAGGRIVETLAWLSRRGEPWLTERRELAVGLVDPGRSAWRLDCAFALTNPRGAPAVFSSPGVKGRDSGYGGLFWRGPASFVGADIIGPDGLAGPGAMGARAAWLACVSPKGWLPQATVAIADDPGNPGSPVKWFVRREPYACLAPTFMYDREFTLAPGATATFRYRVLVADGAPDRTTISSILQGGH